MFPGRTLEEIDDVDIARLYRVLEARSIESLEDKRKQQIAGSIKGEDIESDEWEQIRKLDAIAREIDVNG